MLLISACLAGENCRYNGTNKYQRDLAELVKNNKAISFCPEHGSGIPREPCEIAGGDGADVLCGKAKVMSKDGHDKTEDFIKGANEMLLVCKQCGIDRVILQRNSPSCGAGSIYDGTFCGKTIRGDGVAAALLKQNGIEVRVR